jgi:AraC-like DNA-binding protein
LQARPGCDIIKSAKGDSTALYFDFLLNRGFRDLNPITIGSEHCRPDKSFGPDMRGYTLIHYVVKGKGYLRKFGRTYPVCQGQAFIINPGEIVVYYAEKTDPWYYQWIGFDGQLSKKFAELPPVVSFSSNWIGMMLDCPADSAMREYEITSVLFRMYADLFADKKHGNHYVRRVRDCIQTQYMYNLKVENIASEMNLDRRYLSRIFKASTGKSIQEYLVAVRLEEAVRRLSYGFSVGETAVLCGYGDVCNFSKMFKKRYGISPGQWKKAETAPVLHEKSADIEK